MASIGHSPSSSSIEHTMTSKKTSLSSRQSLTPPGSPTEEPAMPQKTMKNSVHLHEVLKEVLISLAGTGPPRTHLCKDQLSADPDKSRLNLLEEVIGNDRSPITSNGESGTAQCDQMADEIDLRRPICTTQEDSASFKKWESTQQFAKVVEIYLKYLFGMFLEQTLLDLPNQEPPNTPVSQDQLPPGPDMVRLKQLLVKLARNECVLAELSVATKPTQASSKLEEGEQVADDLNSPICTTPDAFKSFEKWASTSQYKTVVETWDKEACKYKVAEPVEISSGLDDYAEYAFVVRERVERNSEEVMPYIDIKSEGLRDNLRKVLYGIKAISLMEDKPSIEQNILFHFLPELDKYAENMNNSECEFPRQHLRLLIDHLKQAYSATSQRLESMLQHGHITYDLLWALFKPGSQVFATCFGTKEPRCVIFDAGEEMTRNDETWFNLECRFLDYDGLKFGEAGIFLRVAKFRGSKPIESLEAFPLRYHSRNEQVREDLVERGRKFRDLAGSHTRHCKGSTFFMNKGKAIKLKIDSRVAVDAAFFHEMQPNYSRPSLRDTGVKEKDGIAFFDMDAMFTEDREREKERMRGDGADAQKLSEADLLIACPTVCCFSFKEKIFLECAVSALRDVNWSPESFDCLQIPPENKTLLLSMAKTRLGMIPTVPFDDVIDGKGQGLNILLDGPPGVGKTFTVEATSEHFELPLYSISAGELVVDHGDSNALEQQLETVFKIAKHFKAVLLLDEADAFMEQRTSYHDTHNRLVTVFLRKLEYYQGILFLTSNRGIQFDDAIISRIHLIIKYKDLSKKFRRDLWSTFLARARTVQGPAMTEERDLQRLERLELNGREIKNIAAIAHALAEANASQVNYKYLELAAESNQKFSKEFGRQGPSQGMYL